MSTKNNPIDTTPMFPPISYTHLVPALNCLYPGLAFVGL